MSGDPRDDGRLLYAPINTLKPVADSVWIVDGPAIRYGLPWPRMRFPTRMTVLRLGRGDLFIHSPTELAPALRDAVQDLGRPRWIVAPSRIHYWWVPQWHAAFPDAAVYLAPRVREQAGRRIDFPARPLAGPAGYPWDAELATLPIAGSYLTEVEFFHHASRTLILTDLIENFEPGKLGSPLARWLTRLGGVQDPDGQMPRDMRLTFARRRAALRAAVDQMIAWEPERVILAHGRWYPRDGAAELRRAFRWLRA
ncbi:DUF4336 domain-containing protein [Bordetella genomosp. 2]|uniref:DUF4336 domain-containing protein n=1 Tax=Bordetella genomosp. 2 TaxID=1983456 RepID=A0A261VQJ5_9BORD|nr:DUF4336 domain-containing protein [Bordetella genomosp. 2]OZI76384.1 DUF4336 domain-containing protein [Bordetella genomosp. 2]